MANVDDDLEIINGDEADEDATDLKNLDVTAPEPEIDEEVVEGEDIDLKLLKTIPTIYTDIIAEFADVEIFMISLDSLLLELLSHSYHNFENLGGQTIVFAAQIECFLRKLTELRAKFKFVAFTDFTPLYNQDTILSFYYNFMIVYLQKHEKYHEDLEFFKNPLDVKYGDFLHRLTPSFLLMSIENASLDQSHLALENDFSKRFLSIAIHLISLSIPVMYFSSFTINFSSVMSYRLFTSVLKVSDMEKKIEAIWDKSYDLPQRKPDPTVYKSTAEFLTHITKEELKKGRDKEEDFPEICAAAIMSALVGMKRGVARNYLPAKQVRKGLALIRLRRALLQAIAIKLATIDTKCLNFPMEDLWDGRLILTIFEAIVGKEKILPFRIQQEFAEFHKLADLKVPIQTDEGDRLLDPPSPSTPRKLLIDDLELYSIDSRLVDEFVPEFNEIFANRKLREKPDVFYEDAFRAIQWQFNRIEMRIFQEEKKEKEKLKNLNTRQLKNANRKRQKLMLWYQNFADSLGGEFLVDFTRTPRTKIEEIDVEADSKNTKKGGAHKKGGKQAEPKKSKADLIKEQNLKKQQAKQFETEKNSIEFMMKLPGNALAHLEEQFKKLELAESKAYCAFVIVQKLADEFERQVQKLDLEEKRLTAVELVGKIKECFTTHWKNLDEKQKEKVSEIWMALGFEPNPKKKGNTQMNLEIDLVNYQLYYGGRLIDIMSDPQKDERVTGFKPDNWQRDMIDAVDKFHSALIIAPTSAGKTFVSYYCMEKILRQSDEDVVVYVSPSNALSHQVCGSVYARFKNKSMSGGKNLFGTMTTDRSDNALNCQVLVVLPEGLEQLLTSPDSQIQAFVSKIKYVILDEVHCINAADMRNESKGHIWEHIFLLIRCPFLALSATINNIDDMYNWLKNAEIKKSMPGTKPRQVELITYSERWSELELAMQKLTAGGPNAAKEIKDDWDTFCKNSKGLQADRLKKAIEEVSTIEEDTESRTSTPALRESTLDIRMSLLKFFTPFSMFKPEKIRLFGIPGDQLLTARQIAELYTLMSSIDEATKKQFAPTKYFKDAAERDAKERGLAEMDKVWLNRKILRDYEKALKEKFMDWLLNDELKSRAMFEKLEAEVEDELEYRSKPFDMNSTALYNIVPLMDDLKEKSMLPALCFNEDRSIIRRLAVRVFNELEKRESEFLRSSEFKKINFQKAEAKYEKLMKRKRDEAEKKKERKNRRGSDEEQEQEKETEVDAEADAFAKQRSRLKEAMKRFKLLGPNPDEEMFNKTVERLMSGYAMEREDTKILYRLIERGIGYHYDGMNNAERGCVEILFRNGYLGIVFSTSTLALGMNMPCKTVIFGIDTNKLTPLQFRQMSGRAGRRGYDSAGTVIFMALPTSKTRRLLTASLATLRGNAPYTTSFLLRLFDYVNGWKDQEKSIIEAKEKFKKGKIVDTTDTLNTEVRIKAALTLLDNCFALYTKDEAKRGAFNRLLKYLTLFNVQLLRREQLLNAKCELTGFAQVATALSSFEPGNLVFVHILQKGEFHKLCKKYAEEPKKLQDTLILILAHIFTNKRLPISYDTGDDSNKPALKPMPDEFQTLVDEYNSNVDKLLLAFLQLATEKRHLQSPVFELTGKIKEDSLDTAHLDVVSPFDEDLILDEKLMPAAARTLYDHRGNKIQMNSYAYDFWKNGSKDDLIKINKLSQLEYWYLIDNFSHVLIGIYSALFDVSKQRDKLLDVMREIADEYEDKFKKAFSMRSNIEETVTVEGKREKTKKMASLLDFFYVLFNFMTCLFDINTCFIVCIIVLCKFYYSYLNYGINFMCLSCNCSSVS